MGDIYYLGYHLKPEGKLLITEIKNRWDHNLNKIEKQTITLTSLSFEDKLKNLFFTFSL